MPVIPGRALNYRACHSPPVLPPWQPEGKGRNGIFL